MIELIYNLASMVNLQLFAEAGNVVNVTTGTVNAYTGVASASGAMSVEMKTYYDTELLENTREKLTFQQLGRKQSLPANHGRVIEWRKWNTLPDSQVLVEGVIPEGRKLGMTSTTVELTQFGQYVTVSDLLDLHAIDDVILGATEEIGAASGLTFDKLVRATLMANPVKMMADHVNGSTVTEVANRAGLAYTSATNHCNITADTIAKAVTILRKRNVPFYTGNKYVAVIHPSCVYDLRKDPAWLDAHKYAAPEEIFNGEIGELHGVRFIESTLAPVVQSGDIVIYQTMFFGKDAFATIDPAGGGMETIVKTREQVGGPLNQFSTIGTKFEMACKVLYANRMLTVESTSTYSGSDEANDTMVTTQTAWTDVDAATGIAKS